MDRQSLEALLRVGGSLVPVADTSMLSCGCLVLQHVFDTSLSTQCTQCDAQGVYVVGPVEPMRQLYHMLDINRRQRRRSLLKQLVIHEGVDTTDLMLLFYKYAKEDQVIVDTPPSPQASVENSQSTATQSPSVTLAARSKVTMDNLYEQNILNELTEEKEYNFSKCFPLHRKLTTHDTQKFKLINPFKGLVLKKSPRYIGSSISTMHQEETNVEVTRFVLITDKRWELFEYVVPINVLDSSHSKPQLICCGRSTGEFGENDKEMESSDDLNGEIIIKNDFNQRVTTKDADLQKKLQLWEFVLCELTDSHLVIAGTRGLVRVFNILRNSPYRVGQPVYTYSTNFPIRCIAASNRGLIATGVTAKERLSGKEQPFIILHLLVFGKDHKIKQAVPITITAPYRDPIKRMCFNATASHLICTTLWEFRYMVIKLRLSNSDNYRKPRLVWSDFAYIKPEDDRLLEVDLMKSTEGITDIRFGAPFSNTIFIALCSLKQCPPMVVRLEGAMIDSVNDSDNYSVQNSMGSVEDDDYIKCAEVFMKFPETGSFVYKTALLPRGDGVVFLGKDGKLYLVSTGNFHVSTPTTSKKKIAVLLGEVAGAENYKEAALIEFSTDGGKIFSVDRKGQFCIFDFTKGVPGKDFDVVKCKIIL